MPDLTILYVTASLVPLRWREFQTHYLLKAAGDSPIITVSRTPFDFGVLNLIDSEPKSYWNLYMQILRAAQHATTPYVALAEDDTLYTPEHFHSHRPPLNSVAYNRSRWSLWGDRYSLRQRISNCSLIASRDYLIDALTERKEVWSAAPPPDTLLGEVGRPNVDSRLKVSRRNMEEFYARNPIVQLNHEAGTDKLDYGIQGGKHMIKKHAQIQAFDIPYWGKATDILRQYA